MTFFRLVFLDFLAILYIKYHNFFPVLEYNLSSSVILSDLLNIFSDEMRKLLNSGMGVTVLSAVEATLSLLVPAAKQIRTEYAVYVVYSS